MAGEAARKCQECGKSYYSTTNREAFLRLCAECKHRNAVAVRKAMAARKARRKST